MLRFQDCGLLHLKQYNHNNCFANGSTTSIVNKFGAGFMIRRNTLRAEIFCTATLWCEIGALSLRNIFLFSLSEFKKKFNSKSLSSASYLLDNFSCVCVRMSYSLRTLKNLFLSRAATVFALTCRTRSLLANLRGNK